MLQALNLILLTSSELSHLRDLLKKSSVNEAGKDLYLALYNSWCHSPMAIISLCLLSQARAKNFELSISALCGYVCYCGDQSLHVRCTDAPCNCIYLQTYEHASTVIQSLAEEDINVKCLVQLDKLINLLETPIFAYLRLQVLQINPSFEILNRIA